MQVHQEIQVGGEAAGRGSSFQRGVEPRGMDFLGVVPLWIPPASQPPPSWGLLLHLGGPCNMGSDRDSEGY